MTDAVIEIRGLGKSYGEVEALCGIDLTIGRGEVFAILGPNGAGKTTMVEILEGYRDRDAGEVTVLGRDPARAGRDWRARVGMVLQDGRLEPELTVRESLRKYAGYYRVPRDVEATIVLTGLSSKADVRARRLSGGQQRRLDVALALIGDPELLFLDEPTTGFDPEARRVFWGVIGGLRSLGKTIVLTTHSMDEAQELADRVVVIADGRIVAEGTPAEIGGRGSLPSLVRFTIPSGVDAELPPAFAGAVVVDGVVEFEIVDPLPALGELWHWADSRGVVIADIDVHRPSLEDVYLRLVGQ